MTYEACHLRSKWLRGCELQAKLAKALGESRDGVEAIVISESCKPRRKSARHKNSFAIRLPFDRLLLTRWRSAWARRSSRRWFIFRSLRGIEPRKAIAYGLPNDLTG
jgi:hypothetical protein